MISPTNIDTYFPLATNQDPRNPLKLNTFTRILKFLTKRTDSVEGQRLNKLREWSMRLNKLRKAMLILGVSSPLILLAACENSAFKRSDDKKSGDQNTSNQAGPNYGNPAGQSNTDATGYPNGTNGDPSQIGPNGYSNGGINPNGFSGPGGINGVANSYNPLGFPVAPGGLTGFGGDTPLVLDWDRDGKISLSSKQTSFDINGDGLADATDWASPAERILAIDLNNNGKIDSGKELFGSAMVDQRSFVFFDQGFQALASFDLNKDGRIDSQDEVFSKLLLWHDKNSNGISETGELSYLAQSEVVALSLNFKTIPIGSGAISGSRSRIGFTSMYETREGQYLLADVIFFNIRNRNNAGLVATLREGRAE